MMKNQSVFRVLTGFLSVTALAFCFAAQTAYAQRPTKRVAPKTPSKRVASEVAVGGITAAERVVRQNTLRAQLKTEMPDGAMETPIRVELTDKDRADLAAPWQSGTPLRIGVVKAVTPAVEVVRGQAFDRGVLQETPDGGFVWAVTVTSPEAQAIRVHFTSFSLPPKAEMYFFNPEGVADGPYVGKGRNGNGDFWSRSISSDTGVIQLRYSGKATESDLRKISFVISELAHIHNRRHLQPGQGGVASHDTWPCADNASCVVDANCVNGTPADPAKDAVAKMEWIRGPFVFTCSGGLLADTVPATQIPYFLTANHCFSRSISNLETWFSYTTDSCNGVCPHNILTGGAPPSDTVGITVLRTNSSSDFTLATLDGTPPAGVTFLGWNSTPIASSNGAHLYRISNPNFGPQGYSQHDVDTGSPTCGGIPRGDWIYSADITGATLGGSSGSPVLNSASEVVGQLTGCCGFNCADECAVVPTNWTIDGAFAAYFDEVDDLLDPQVGCTGDPDCDDGDACNGLETCVSGSCQAGTPVNCDDGDACTADSCDPGTGACSNDPISCDDGDPCTADSCDPGSGCVNTPAACGPADGCCGASCTPSNDPDCTSCLPQGASCTENSQCCSNKCRGRSGNQSCKSG